MKGYEEKLVAFMEGSKKRFVIPVYQRNYDWKTENCKQLFDDLVKVIKNNRKSHFFGSIVSVYNPSGKYQEYLIIDGQQRLTTVSLLLLAMYNLIQQGVVMSEEATLSQEIYEEYLIDKWQPKEKRIKLKPVKNDNTAFGKLFEDQEEHISESNLTANYNYFYDRIKRREITIDELYNAICCLEIINIELNQDDEPQLIFESLNSTGLALSEGDKIRNLILMGLPNNLQEDYYEKYWNKIEENTKYDVSLFIRDYLSVKQSATPAMSKVYYTFKNFVEDTNVDTETLLANLLAYSKLYNILLTGNIKNVKLSSCINRLNRLETVVTRPFFLEVLRLNQEETISLDEVTEIFQTVENYVFRRNICDLPTNALNKVFLYLHKEIMRYDGTSDNYLEKFKYAMLSKKEKNRFPDDEEFAIVFTTKAIYQMNSKNKHYLFERLENFGTYETKDVWELIDQGEYSIEHIMPQHLTPKWVESLGEDYQEIHETWLHRIANLTLTAYNSKYSNNTFIEKRDMKNGFKDSGIRMNQQIAQQETWGLPEIEIRSNYMKDRAVKIWSSPITTYTAPVKQLDSCSLDEDIEFTNRIVTKFSYKNIEQPVESWVDLYQKVLKLLHSEDKTVLVRLAHIKDNNVELSTHVSNDPQDFSSSVEIDNDIYVWSNSSTQYKVNLLRRFFTLYNAAPSDLVFFLKEADNNVEEEGSRYDIRRKYWEYAIPVIQNEYDSESFKNVTGTKENWINGSFGISACSIVCVANFDSARVELYLGKGDINFNKKAFDVAFSQKNQIEQELGISLVWDRGNDKKSSKVTYEIKNISIGKEDDWTAMANFHAEWSKKFYDTFVPIIQEVDRTYSK